MKKIDNDGLLDDKTKWYDALVDFVRGRVRVYQSALCHDVFTRLFKEPTFNKDTSGTHTSKLNTNPLVVNSEKNSSSGKSGMYPTCSLA